MWDHPKALLPSYNVPGIMSPRDNHVLLLIWLENVNCLLWWTIVTALFSFLINLLFIFQKTLRSRRRRAALEDVMDELEADTDSDYDEECTVGLFSTMIFVWLTNKDVVQHRIGYIFCLEGFACILEGFGRILEPVWTNTPHLSYLSRGDIVQK